MKKANPFDDYAGIARALSQYSDALSKFNIENYSRLLDSLSKNIALSDTISEITQRQMALFDRLDNYPLRQYERELSAAQLQWDALGKIAEAYKTPELDRLEKALMQSNLYAIRDFADNILKASYIEAPNIAFLKTAKIFEHTDLDMPKGISTVLKKMHVDTAKRLAYSEDISLDVKSRLFYIESFPYERVNVDETNIICSSLHLLSDLDETDLIIFLNYLEQHPNLALNNPTGRRILEIIQQWDDTIDFDRPYYYHARALDDGACPYTENELRRAPAGVTWHGRFNFVGQSHYYFSDMPKGALMEVAKHTKLPRIQVAKLRPIKPIRMIDLSHEIKTKNKFLDYCRFGSLNDNVNIHREYLIPCFVADCCRASNIEGIKYYGSKEYKNYVSWEDSYFSIVGSELHDSQT